MRKRVDLHLHTTASDGRLAPEELVQIAAEQGISVIAITDHDTLAGVEQALAAAQIFPVTVIPGLEINTDVPNGEVHILGYFVDHKNEELINTLDAQRSSRQKRAMRMVDKLEKLGIFIEWQRVLELANGGSIGRPHIAQVMFEGKHVPNLQEAFEKYIGRNGPAYAERDRLSPAEAVSLIVRANGLPVLAHPANILDIEPLIVELKQAGLIGMEVYYDNYNRDTIRRLLKIADKYGLISTGGSDFHGFEDKHETPLGEANVPIDCAVRLIAMSRKYHQSKA